MATRLIKTLSQLRDVVSRLLDEIEVGFDIETVGLDPFSSKQVMWQFGSREDVFIVDMRDKDPIIYGEYVRPLFDGGRVILGMNIKFDLSFMLYQSAVQATRVYDIQIADYIIMGLGVTEARNQGIGMSLKDIAKRYKLAEVSKEERSWFIDLDQREEWGKSFPKEQIEYAARDITLLFEIYDLQQPRILKGRLRDAINTDMRALPAVVNIEVDGVHLNRVGWLATIDEAKRKLDLLETELHTELDPHILAVRVEQYDALYGPYHDWELARQAYLDSITALYKDNPAMQIGNDDILTGWGNIKKYLMTYWNANHPKPVKPKEDKSIPNLASTQQLRNALNHMRLGEVKGKTGPIEFYTTEEKFLAVFADRFPIIDKILAYKHLDKLIVAFGDKLLEKINPVTGRLHASYHLVGAGTGRMSSYNPNFQQIPAKGPGAELRQNVVAPEGSTLVISDFSNIELRIIAELSGDENLLAAFASGKDVHSMTASLMFGLPIPEGVDAKKFMDGQKAVLNGRTLEKSYRAIAKQINFMLIYGGGAAKLAGMLGVTVEEARKLMAIYFDTYKGVKVWLSDQHRAVDDKVRELEIARREAKVGGENRNGIKSIVASHTVGGRARYYRVPNPPNIGRGATADDVDAYKKAKEEYSKELASIKRKMGNSPIQGTSADITKEALALWHERVNLDPEWGRLVALVAVVHDELIVECVAAAAWNVQKMLADIMSEATHKYLTRVYVPTPDVVISDHWEH